MSLQSRLRKGDWIKATSDTTGCVLIGQADRDIGLTGFAALGVVIQGDGGSPQIIEINVNYWDVVRERANIIGGMEGHGRQD